MAFTVLAAAPLGIVLARRRSLAPSAGSPAAAGGSAIRSALRDPNFLFLTAGFFACGYQLAFMAVHLPGFLIACHLGPNVGAAALAVIGFFNVIGSFAFGPRNSTFFSTARRCVQLVPAVSCTHRSWRADGLRNSMSRVR
jgi:hypothetical protein